MSTSFLKRVSTNIVEATGQEFAQEAAITRRLLERTPADQLAWKPHPKSMSIGALALHIASGPEVFAGWIEKEVVDLSESKDKPQPTSLDEILSAHEQSVRTVKKLLQSLSEADVQGMCTLRKHGATFMTMPKLAVLRTLILNRLIHHRGQLSVYLRLLNVPVPSMYGPSADEGPFATV